jgi:2-methylcitrate dehydratase PrpD
MGVLRGAITPSVFTPNNYADPRVLELMNKIHLEVAPEFDFTAPAAEVLIETVDGRTYRRRVERTELRGLPERPMSDAEIRSKFIECAEELMSEAQVDRVIDACLGIERLPRFSEILPLLRVPPKALMRS